MSSPQPKEKDFDVEVQQGASKGTWLIRAPDKAGAINQANRILKRQGIRPAKVISATERKA